MSNKILIVDDEVNIVIALEFLMAQAGYKVEVARTRDETIERLAHFIPDVILLDVMLPGIDGFDILQRIRMNPAWQHIAVIMVTARGREVEVTRGLALGADAHITKPFSARDLLAEVKRCLNPPHLPAIPATKSAARGLPED